MGAFSDSIKAAWLQSLDFLDPDQQLFIIGPNGKRARCLATSFLESEKLSETGYNSTLPSVVELLRDDFVQLAIADRSAVNVAGHNLVVIVISDEPVDPCVQLTVTKFS